MLEKVSSFLEGLSNLPRWQLAVIAVLFLAVAAGAFLLLRPGFRPQADFRAVEEGGESERPREVTVHVAGAVAHPGVVLLEEGARVMEAIQAAGGPLPEADLDALNLAQILQDGQKLLVPRKGESVSSGGSEGYRQGKVNLNTAGQRELEELPGIGPTLARRIIDYRERTGGFRSVDELKKVSGIGQKKFEEIRDLVEV